MAPGRPATSEPATSEPATSEPASANKRARLSTPDLEDQDKAELKKIIRKLEAEITRERTSSRKARGIALAARTSTDARPHLWLSTEQMDYLEVNRALSLMAKGIRDQMTWHQTYKSGSDKFSVTIHLLSLSAFSGLIQHFLEPTKESIQVSAEQFNDEIVYRFEHAHFRITSDYVTMTWNEKDSEITVSGSCGEMR